MYLLDGWGGFYVPFGLMPLHGGGAFMHTFGLIPLDGGEGGLLCILLDSCPWTRGSFYAHFWTNTLGWGEGGFYAHFWTNALGRGGSFYAHFWTHALGWGGGAFMHTFGLMPLDGGEELLCTLLDSCPWTGGGINSIIFLLNSITAVFLQG